MTAWPRVARGRILLKLLMRDLRSTEAQHENERMHRGDGDMDRFPAALPEQRGGIGFVVHPGDTNARPGVTPLAFGPLSGGVTQQLPDRS